MNSPKIISLLILSLHSDCTVRIIPSWQGLVVGSFSLHIGCSHQWESQHSALTPESQHWCCVNARNTRYQLVSCFSHLEIVTCSTWLSTALEVLYMLRMPNVMWWLSGWHARLLSMTDHVFHFTLRRNWKKQVDLACQVDAALIGSRETSLKVKAGSMAMTISPI